MLLFIEWRLHGKCARRPATRPTAAVTVLVLLVSTGLASADSVLSTVKVGNQPFTPLADPSNGHVYVPNTNSSSISVISGTGDVATSG